MSSRLTFLYDPRIDDEMEKKTPVYGYVYGRAGGSMRMFTYGRSRGLQPLVMSMLLLALRLDW